jgi:hypothetical protein
MKKFLLFIPFLFLLVGCGNMGSGTHTGYVTAIEKTGVIWKTGGVYFKTSMESTQEDHYCVENNDLYKKLEEKSLNKENITIEFHEEFFVAPWRCDYTVVIDNIK